VGRPKRRWIDDFSKTEQAKRLNPENYDDDVPFLVLLNFGHPNVCSLQTNM